jgi:cell division protein FtsI (penicillin-binding protein 3)
MKRKKSVTPYPGRPWFLLGLFALSALLLSWRAIDQQLLQGDSLQQKGLNWQIRTELQPAYRGEITDRHGTVLALSTPLVTFVANPKVLTAQDPSLPPLAQALGLSLSHLQEKLERHKNKYYMVLKKRLPPDQAAHIQTVLQTHQIPGVRGETDKPHRYYPTGEIFSQIVGFANQRGQEGLELAYNGHLQGITGKVQVIRDGKNKAIQIHQQSRLAQDGKPLTLSLDHRLQYIAYRELKAAVNQHQANSGSAVLLDVTSGEVLAMVNQPSYNPNDRSARQGARLRNRAITDVFEPGSTMKPFIVAAALEQGQLHADSQVDTSGWITLGKRRIQDHTELGRIDLTTLLGRSSNEGAARIALSLDKTTLWQQLTQFGFGQSLHTGFPAEATGHLPHDSQWSRIDQASLAFGYGLSATTLQLAQAYATLGNDGVQLPISLLKQDRPTSGKRILSSDTARTVRQLLHRVVSPGGTAPQAAIAGYPVAGKTGTVKKIRRGSYSDDRYRAIFVGLAPLDQPRLALAIMIDEPNAGEYYGGRVVGPVFANIMREALRLMQIPPAPQST